MCCPSCLHPGRCWCCRWVVGAAGASAGAASREVLVLHQGRCWCCIWGGAGAAGVSAGAGSGEVLVLHLGRCWCCIRGLDVLLSGRQVPGRCCAASLYIVLATFSCYVSTQGNVTTHGPCKKMLPGSRPDEQHSTPQGRRRRRGSCVTPCSLLHISHFQLDEDHMLYHRMLLSLSLP